MPVTKNEAAHALRDIVQTERRSGEAYGYQRAAPHLIIWGVVWAVGYGLTYFKPQWQLSWPLLVVAGNAASFWIGRREQLDPHTTFRYVATLIAVVIFVSATALIMAPVSSVEIGAFFPLLVALFYAIIGIWTGGNRMIVLSILISVLTLTGFFYLPHYFSLWMALVGGGGLMLGGLWLRSV